MLGRAYERRRNEGTSSTSEGTSKPSPVDSRSMTSDVPGVFNVAWDGLDAAGQSLSPGVYHYRVVPVGGALAVAAQGTLSGMTPGATGVVYHLGNAVVRADDLISVG